MLKSCTVYDRTKYSNGLIGRCFGPRDDRGGARRRATVGALGGLPRGRSLDLGRLGETPPRSRSLGDLGRVWERVLAHDHNLVIHEVDEEDMSIRGLRVRHVAVEIFVPATRKRVAAAPRPGEIFGAVAGTRRSRCASSSSCASRGPRRRGERAGTSRPSRATGRTPGSCRSRA